MEYLSVFIYKISFSLAEKNQNAACLVEKTNLFQTS